MTTKASEKMGDSCNFESNQACARVRVNLTRSISFHRSSLLWIKVICFHSGWKLASLTSVLKCKFAYKLASYYFCSWKRRSMKRNRSYNIRPNSSTCLICVFPHTVYQDLENFNNIILLFLDFSKKKIQPIWLTFLKKLYFVLCMFYFL